MAFEAVSGNARLDENGWHLEQFLCPPASVWSVLVDEALNLLHNYGMSIDTIPTAIDDMHAVSEAFLAGRAVDAEVARRVHERAAELRQRLIAEHGLQDLSVPLLRQARETGP